MKASLFIAAGLALAFTGAANATPIVWDMVYNADVKPADAGSIVFSNSTTDHFNHPYADANTVDSADGIYTAATSAADAFQYPLGLSTDYLASATGYTVESSFRINSIATESTSPFVIQCGDMSADQAWTLAPSRSGTQYTVTLYGANANLGVVANIDNTQFHTYRVTVLGSTATLYVDNAFVGQLGAMDTSATNHNIEFGNLSSSSSGSFSMDYLDAYAGGAVPAPEPTTLGLLGVGGLMMLRRRRR
jgi:hypothetical protein